MGRIGKSDRYDGQSDLSTHSAPPNRHYFVRRVEKLMCYIISFFTKGVGCGFDFIMAQRAPYLFAVKTWWLELLQVFQLETGVYLSKFQWKIVLTCCIWTANRTPIHC